MSMPMGHKAEHGNSSISDIEGAHGYREISEIMTNEGDEMNHATARHVFIRAMEKIAIRVSIGNGKRVSQSEIQRIAKDPRFQSSVMEYLRTMDGK